MGSKKMTGGVGKTGIVDFARMSARGLARAWGVSERSVYNWTVEGMPRNADGSYSMPDCFGWYMERAKPERGAAGDETRELQNEKLRRQIEILSDEVEKRRSEYMSVSEHKEILCRKAANLRDMFLTGCRKYAHEFVGLKDAAEAQDCLMQFVTHSLNFYAGAKPSAPAG